MARPGSMVGDAIKNAPTPSSTILSPGYMNAKPGTLLHVTGTADPDYDYANAAAAGVKPEVADDGTLHLSDQYKLPNHITFSQDSIYADKDAGKWDKVGDVWHFTPGATNLKYHSMDELRDYFKKHESKSVLVEPK